MGITISSVHIFHQVCKISVTDFQLLNSCYLITFASHSTVRYIIKVRHCVFLLYSGVLTFCLIFNLTWCGNYVKYNDFTGNNREVLSVIRNLMLLLNIILGIAAYKYKYSGHRSSSKGVAQYTYSINNITLQFIMTSDLAFADRCRWF